MQENPILDAIDAKKNILTLDQTKRALTQLEVDAKSRQDQFASQLAVYQEQRNRSLLNVTQELHRIAQTKTLAPMTGLVAIRQNRAGNFNFGQQMPDIREGDTLQPGMPVADVLDLSEVEVWAKVGELDRANLKEGQDALLQLDAIPDKQFHGKIKALSGTATSDVFSGDPSKKFDVVFSVDMRQLLAGLGMKPADVDRIMATAVENAKKNLGVPSGRSIFGAAAADQGGAPGGMPGAEDNPGSRRRAGRPWRAVADAAAGHVPGGPPENAGFDQTSSEWHSGGAPEADRAVHRRHWPAARHPRGAAPAGGAVKAAAPAAGGRVKGRRPGRGAGGAARGSTWPRGRQHPARVGQAVQRFAYTEEERNNAKLPLPPEQDSQVQVLLRPGLLADVEIQVEKIPNALHVPAQAVFQKNGKPTVFVQQKNSRFEPREVQLVKQSESMMVLASRRAGGRYRGAFRSHGRQVGQEGKRAKRNRRATPWAACREGNSHDRFFAHHSRIEDGAGQPLCAQAAQPADHARHDLRRGRGGGHALHHRRRAEADDELHRPARRQQHHRGGARSGGPQRAPDRARDFAGAELPRFPGHLGKRARAWWPSRRARRFKPQKLLPKTAQEPPQLDRRAAQFRGDQQPEAGRAAASSPTTKTRLRRRSACWAKAPK